VGILLIPLEIMLVLLAMLFGWFAAALLLGNRIWAGFGHGRQRQPNQLLALASGLVLLTLVGWVPFVGWLVRTVVWLTGFGAVLTTLADLWRERQRSAQPVRREEGN
jgi:hypothetical protein